MLSVTSASSVIQTRWPLKLRAGKIQRGPPKPAAERLTKSGTSACVAKAMTRSVPRG